ncbi:uncharacterized protein LOC126367422 [Pectinophora gossypiella]|uniref:uncharacterized protein LOC126367422 n=1 Tax=Pectinophora gossypiella TaxID=13191 RepID=UPI00214EDEA6|nr:uncharacterized protein LOC126367422 [Pectinophora gossypiella]
MNILWLIVLLHTVFAKTRNSFGYSYLKDTKLCQPWTCINNKLGLPDSLPPRDQFSAALRLLLPLGPWQDVVEDVLNVCYGDRPRIYTNTCPGQALLHCTVDNLIQYCPDQSWRKDDACAPVSSLAGLMYMFQQSRYENLEIHLPADKRPSWFLKNYFNSKCCNLPNLFNSSLLNECGFKSVILYHTHEPRTGNSHTPEVTTTTARNDGDVVKLVDLNAIRSGGDPADVTPNNDLDPLACCDLSGFIDPSWRQECNFHVTWDKDTRMTVQTPPEPVTVSPTTTARPGQMRDVKVVPETCEKQSCVFRKLNIISDSGSVDIDAFSKLLDNMTSAHASWTKAKARVVTKCLSKPITDYVEDCEINKVLACTFDVLSENCPHSPKHDICKHSSSIRNDTMCQISASKFRPKHRRQYCGLPNLVNPEVLAECGMNSITRMEYVPDPVTSRPKTHWWSKASHSCKTMTDSTKCLLNKMGVLNKYGFLDYFKMKDSIRKFTSEHSWATLTEAYLTFFIATPCTKTSVTLLRSF